MRHLTLATAPVLAVTCGAPASAELHVVDPAALVGPATIQEAVDAAQDGDTVLLLHADGFTWPLDSVVIDGKGLAIVAQPQPGGLPVRGVTVRNLGPDQTVSLQGLWLRSSSSPVPFTLEDCLGAVRLDSCISDSIEAVRCGDVVLSRCEIRGTPGFGPDCGDDGVVGLRLEQSRAALLDTTVRGGAGGSPLVCYPNDVIPAGDGAPALTLEGRSYLWCGGSQLQGGAGGYGASGDGVGGHALVVGPASVAIVLGSELRAAAGGMDFVGSPTFAPGRHRQLETFPRTQSGRATRVEVTGQPGEQVTLFVGRGGSFRPLAPPHGVVGVRDLAMAPIDLGAIDSDGILAQDVLLPAVGGTTASTYVLQAVVTDASGVFRMTDVSVTTLYGEQLPSIFPGGVVYVDADAAPGGNGRSWGTAFQELRDALRWRPFQSDSSIWVAEGRYTPAIPGAPRGFPLRNGLTLLGGFQGGESMARDADPSGHLTVLDGDLNGDDVGTGNYSDNVYRVIDAPDYGNFAGHPLNPLRGYSAVRIDGFTVRGGAGPQSNVIDGDVRIGRCAFVENAGRALVFGDGLTRRLRVDRCVFRDNARGAISLSSEAETSRISNSVFLGPSVGSTISIGSSGEDIRVIGNTFHGTEASGGFYPRVIGWTQTARVIVANNLFSEIGAAGAVPWPQISSNATRVERNAGPELDTLWPGAMNSSLDPLYVDPLGSDGVAGTADDVLELSVASPFLDAGDSDWVVHAFDLLDRPRLVDLPGATNTGDGASPFVDLGAFERQQ